MAEMEKQDCVPFLEVMCKASGVARRFAPGTKAGFALSLINSKLDAGAPLGVYIEAVKDGEESINFGPSSVLVSCGTDWKLQTVLDGQSGIKKRDGTQAWNKSSVNKQVSAPGINLVFAGKILIIVLFVFVLGSIFTLFLENLPNLLSRLDSPL